MGDLHSAPQPGEQRMLAIIFDLDGTLLSTGNLFLLFNFSGFDALLFIAFGIYCIICIKRLILTMHKQCKF